MTRQANSNENQDAAKDLFGEALAWPIEGPGQSTWDDWMLRACEALKTNGNSDYHDLLSRFVKTEQEDGLSSGEYEFFLSSAKGIGNQ